MYGKETWRLIKGLTNKSLRSILRIWWPRRICNEGIWKQTGQRPIEKDIKQRAWGWIGHTLRRPDGYVAKGPLRGTRRGSAREGDPDTPGGARECQTWKKEDLRGVRQKILLKIG